jgi:hypothetical protein
MQQSTLDHSSVIQDAAHSGKWRVVDKTTGLSLYGKFDP